MPSKPDESLKWLAARYVLGELAESDADAFEERLANDLAACEAVAEASRLRLVLRAALTETALSKPLVRSIDVPSRHSRFAIVAAMTSVACLFVGVVLWHQDSMRPDGARLTQTNDTIQRDVEEVEVASLWRKGMDVSENEANEIDEEPDDSFPEVAIPGWLLAGVSLENNGVPNSPLERIKEN